MRYDNKTDEQLQAMFREAKNERKKLQALEKELLNEMNRRDSLPELPNFTNYTRTLLTTQNKIDLGHFLETHRSPGEVIDYIEQLLTKGK